MDHPANILPTSSLARIWDEDRKRVCGAGFVIQYGYVMTCAHVIAEAIRDCKKDGAKPPSHRNVWVDFPMLREITRLKATVHEWRPLKTPVSGPTLQEGTTYLVEPEDIAVLQIESLEGMPDEVHDAKLCDLQDLDGHQFAAGGFPSGKSGRGTWVEGTFSLPVGGGLIEVHNLNTPRGFVREGFSGTPAWDKTIKAFVGMVSTAYGANDAYVIPTARLLDVWPMLFIQKGPTWPYETGRETKVDNVSSDLKYLIDREEQVSTIFKGLSNAVRPHNKRPFTVFVHGTERQGHRELVERFLVELRTERPRKLSEHLQQLLGDTGFPVSEPAEIRWPPRDRKVDDRLIFLIKETFLQLNISDPFTFKKAAEQVSTALNGKPEFLILYSLLNGSRFNFHEQKLINRWLDFWNNVAQFHPHPPVNVFICLKYPASETMVTKLKWLFTRQGTTRLKKFFKSDLETRRQALQVAVLDELKPLSFHDIEVWINHHTKTLEKQTRDKLMELAHQKLLKVQLRRKETNANTSRPIEFKIDFEEFLRAFDGFLEEHLEVKR